MSAAVRMLDSSVRELVHGPALSAPGAADVRTCDRRVDGSVARDVPTRTIASIPDDAWTLGPKPASDLRRAVGPKVSDAEVPLTAFASKPKAQRVTALAHLLSAKFIANSACSCSLRSRSTSPERPAQSPRHARQGRRHDPSTADQHPARITRYARRTSLRLPAAWPSAEDGRSATCLSSTPLSTLLKRAIERGGRSRRARRGRMQLDRHFLVGPV